MLVILVSIVLALLLYLFVYLRTELFRITERQSNTLMHMARMHRGLLGGISNMLHPTPEPLVEDAEPTPTHAPDSVLSTIEEVEQTEAVVEEGDQSA
tara:strand:+ start:514 stop:804 length:291 start_codon:yes stop_codon:yes gene_type:complete